MPVVVHVELIRRVVADEPIAKEAGATFGIAGFVLDVGHGVRGMPVPFVELERPIGGCARLFMTEELVVGEGELRQEPPIVAIGLHYGFEQRKLFIVSVEAAAEANQAVDAASLVEDEGIAGVFGDVRTDRCEGTLGVSGDCS